MTGNESGSPPFVREWPQGVGSGSPLLIPSNDRFQAGNPGLRRDRYGSPAACREWQDSYGSAIGLEFTN